MSKITYLKRLPANPPQYPEEKVLVFIDGQSCIPIRARTWQAMNLNVGDSITCAELIEREKYHWKIEYQKAGGWDREKVRIEAVKAYLEKIDPLIEAVVTGFGANTTEFIAAHPDEKGRPDIEVTHRYSRTVLLFVEVSGTEQMRGSSYWIRPDKVAYVMNHPKDDIWIVLHYARPQERLVFFKPVPGVHYPTVQVDIRGSGERMHEIDDGSPGVVPEAIFRKHLLSTVK